MRNQLKFILPVLLPILFLSSDVFARAGGGSGGGSGSIIGLILAGIYSLIVSAILVFKVNKNKKVMEKNISEDSFWNFEAMRLNAEKVFYRMQDAWMDRKIDKVKDIITEKLHDDYKIKLDAMLAKRQKNLLSDINVSDIRIIGCEDYLDNSHDTYIAYIKGKMIDCMLDERTRELIDNDERKSEAFSDTYHFIRKDNKWLLDHIDNKVTIWDLIRTRNYHEGN